MVRTALLIAFAACALAARAQPADLVLEAELSPARVYVGGEARLRLRVLRAPGVTHGVLHPPALGDAADLSLVGPILTYTIERAGVLYEVLERTHVIVPHRAGRLVVPGARFEAALRYAEVFGRTMPIAPRRARAPQRVLEVLAVPPAAGEPWLPARRLTLKESWSRDLDALSPGTPVTRTLVLRAEGLAAERLPRLEMPAHAALLAHYDQPELSTEYLSEGVIGLRVQRIVLMPVSEAEVMVPELRVRWWNVGADAPRSATLAARTLRLQPLIAPTAKLRAPPANVPVPVLMRAMLVVIAVVFALAFWWQLRTRARRAALRALRAACRRGDARGARDALVEWAGAAGIAGRLPQQIGAHWGSDARAQLGALDAALYDGRAWDGRAFWRALRPWLRKRAERRGARASPLPPLFRLQARDGVRPGRV